MQAVLPVVYGAYIPEGQGVQEEAEFGESENVLKGQAWHDWVAELRKEPAEQLRVMLTTGAAQV